MWHLPGVRTEGEAQAEAGAGLQLRGMHMRSIRKGARGGRSRHVHGAHLAQH